jgi:NAD(P)-dependent dehydrogenase (short-subunit alcohol dehydrogenase family)
MRLAQKTAIITGAAGGIGRETAIRFGREGANVVLIDLNEAAATRAAEAITAAGGVAMAAPSDIRDRRRIQQIVADVVQRFGGVDILVNNAGGPADWIGGGKVQRTLFVDATEEAWQLVVSVNLLGPMIVIRAVLDSMIARHRGKIINIASVAGVSGLVRMVDYSAAKGGVIAMTKALAIELGEHNINVNCVSPGSIDTLKGAPPTYLKRPGQPEDVANLIFFLASDESNFITGQNYIIDGGRTLSTKCS